MSKRTKASNIPAAGIIMLGLLGHQAAQAATLTTFTGDAYIEAANNICTQYDYNVGNFYRVIYHYKNSDSDSNDSAAFMTPRADFRIKSNAASGSLNGQTTTVNALIDSRVDFYNNLSGASNLVIASAGGLPTATAINLKMVGTIDNFYDIQGCTVTIHANMVRRPG